MEFVYSQHVNLFVTIEFEKYLFLERLRKSLLFTLHNFSSTVQVCRQCKLDKDQVWHRNLKLSFAAHCFCSCEEGPATPVELETFLGVEFLSCLSCTMWFFKDPPK